MSDGSRWWGGGGKGDESKVPRETPNDRVTALEYTGPQRELLSIFEKCSQKIAQGPVTIEKGNYKGTYTLEETRRGLMANPGSTGFRPITAGQLLARLVAQLKNVEMKTRIDIPTAYNERLAQLVAHVGKGAPDYAVLSVDRARSDFPKLKPGHGLLVVGVTPKGLLITRNPYVGARDQPEPFGPPGMAVLASGYSTNARLR